MNAIELIGSVMTGGVGGALLRLIPEGIGLVKDHYARKERAAEAQLELQRMQLQADIQLKLGAQRIEEVRIEGDRAADLQRILASMQATAPVGIRWVDAWNAMQRPAITSIVFCYFLVYKTALVFANGGLGLAWTNEDNAMLTGILTFWFMGREFTRQNGGK